MKLRERFKQLNRSDKMLDKLEAIADQHAIDFAQWYINYVLSNLNKGKSDSKTMPELLQIFKNETKC